MDESIINMQDMEAIFDITDGLGIDREQIIVPLGKDDSGAVKKLPDGQVEIIVPRTLPRDLWLEQLRIELSSFGFKRIEE